MTIKILKQEDAARWDRYVLESGASNYHRLGWRNVIERGFGHTSYYLYAEDRKGEIHGVLPLVHLKSLFFGSFLVSLPFFNYGGIHARDEQTRRLLLDGSIRIARNVHAEHIELRHVHTLEADVPAKTSKVSMLLDLPGDSDGLWKSFSPKLRSQIRRPLKEGMYARIGREEELNSFYTVFSFNMRDLGTPVYPKEFFRNILEEFPRETWICTVYTAGGQPAASGFLVGFRDTIEIPWASSLRLLNRFSPNMLLYWSALTFACEKKYRVFDFGRSTPGESTYKFKEQWSARPVQLYWHYWLGEKRSIPELSPKNPRFRTAISVWRRLPLGLTQLIGPLIVKNLP
ncbi:MAG: FemAB family PEP-CTERM system-associated protein [Alphaproteobacteria bacterium]|uniref:FemAB family PEP-CTERM system-associated protein n=1 Tax=Candidatus Nitrobium versatile TaxID=2884831 RepID=A0A953M165_9BACT|nr:FemAB family PEP-CTERM system-associated protein [Candidatus Nitrobium versatile]